MLVLRTAKAYKNLFTKEEISMVDSYLNNLSPLAQTIFARLFLRKRVWFNQVIHLGAYRGQANGPDTTKDLDEQMSDAIRELYNTNFINLDEQLLVDDIIKVIENDAKRDEETNELDFNENGFLEKLYQFFESFS